MSSLAEVLTEKFKFIGDSAWLILIYVLLVATDGCVRRCADNMAEGGVSGVINQASCCQSLAAGQQNTNRRQQPAHPPVFVADNVTVRCEQSLRDLLAYIALCGWQWPLESWDRGFETCLWRGSKMVSEAFRCLYKMEKIDL